MRDKEGMHVRERESVNEKEKRKIKQTSMHLVLSRRRAWLCTRGSEGDM